MTIRKEKMEFEIKKSRRPRNFKYVVLAVYQVSGAGKNSNSPLYSEKQRIFFE